MSRENNENTNCPVCDRFFNLKEIQQHVNNCLFLNSREDTDVTPRKRRRSCLNLPLSDSELPSNVSSERSDLPLHEEVNLQPTSSNVSGLKQTYTPGRVPLAEAVRPCTLENFIGHEQIIGRGTILRKLLDGSNLPSLIFWGPPGCGKTTLANVVKEILVKRDKNKTGPPVRFVKLYATMAGVADVKEVINIAKNENKLFHRKTILFMDEIHRFNKSQQDTFLPHIENGTITLIGATTENPSFSLNNALLSRCRVICLNKLSSENIVKILTRAVVHTDGSVMSEESPDSESDSKWSIDAETVQWLADISDGDARIALNSLQMAVESKKDPASRITLDDIKDSIKRSHISYDKKGDEHYNIISALHKSIRASDDNASLYWVMRMLEGGEDPIYVARRLVRASSEDIGLADPNALILAVSTLHGCQQIGMPECDVLLAQLAVYLARCPKSTEVYKAMKKVKATISEHKGALPSVPLHLRNAPTRFMKDLGYGRDYNRQHKDVSGLEYMPEGLEHVSFFNES